MRCVFLMFLREKLVEIWVLNLNFSVATATFGDLKKKDDDRRVICLGGDMPSNKFEKKK